MSSSNERLWKAYAKIYTDVYSASVSIGESDETAHKRAENAVTNFDSIFGDK